MNNDDLNNKSVIELKVIAKEMQIKNFRTLKKLELIDAIQRELLSKNEENSEMNIKEEHGDFYGAQIKKDGIILREKIAKHEVE